jgi:hypothetical protein
LPRIETMGSGLGNFWGGGPLDFVVIWRGWLLCQFSDSLQTTALLENFIHILWLISDQLYFQFLILNKYIQKFFLNYLKNISRWEKISKFKIVHKLNAHTISWKDGETRELCMGWGGWFIGQFWVHAPQANLSHSHSFLSQ